MGSILDSNAFQFASETPFGVDKRTGLFSLTIPIATITGNRGMGPVIDFSIYYSSVGEHYSPYGFQIYDTFTKYDRENKRIILSTGDILKLAPGSSDSNPYFDTPLPLDYRLDIDDDKKIHLIHQDGTIEVFPYRPSTSKIIAPEKIISPQGYSLDLNWSYSLLPGNAHPFLFEIWDSEKLLLSVDAAKSKGSPKVGKINNYITGTTKTFSYVGDTLRKLAFSEFPAPWLLNFKLLYAMDSVINSYYLSNITTPTGLNVNLTMDYEGIKLTEHYKHRYSLNLKELHSINKSFVNKIPRVRRIEFSYIGTSVTNKKIKIDRTIIEYQYGISPAQANSHNFLGYAAKTEKPSGIRSDPLNFVLGEYVYYVMENVIYYRYNDVSKTIGRPVYKTFTVYSYNKFHCKIREETKYFDLLSANNAGKVTPPDFTTYSADYTYGNTVPSTFFNKQPAIYSLPTTIKTTWSRYVNNAIDGTRNESIMLEYDNAGNLTKKTVPEFIEETFTYYPTEGETDLCPAEPHGFTRFMKSHIVTPLNLAGNPPVRKITNTWSDFDTLTEVKDIVSKFVVLSSATLSEQLSSSPEKLTNKTKMEIYYDISDSKSPFYSSIQFETESEADNSAPETIWNLFTETSYTRTLSQDKSSFDIVTETQTYDDLRLSETQTYIIPSLRIKSKKDPLGNTVDYVYEDPDNLAEYPWVRSCVINKGHQEYENTINYDLNFGPFTYPDDELYPASCRYTVTDSTGNIRSDTLDTYGNRVKSEYAKAPDKDEPPVWLTVEKAIFTSNLMHQITSMDYSQEDNSQLVEITNAFRYTDWMQRSQTSSSNGITAEVYYDAVANTRLTRTIQNQYSDSYDGTSPFDTSGSELHQMDAMGNVISVARYNAEHTPPDDGDIPVSKKSYSYDGLGRILTETDEYNNVTSYSMDFFDRIVTITQPTSRIYEYTYQSLHAAPVKVTAKKNLTDTATEAGRRTFDGLGRTISATIGGREYSYGYDLANQIEPTKITKPDGKTLLFTYDPLLGNAMLAVADGSVTDNPKTLKTFTYNNKFGLLASQTDLLSALREEFYWTPQGQLEKSILRKGTDSNGTELFTNSMTYSLNGLTRTSLVSNSGTEIVNRAWEVDSRGRPAVFDDSYMQSSVTFDSMNRVASVTTSNTNIQSPLNGGETTYFYDDYHNVTSIHFLDAGTSSTLVTQEYKYDLMDRLLNKTTSFSNELPDNEIYTYNTLGQLESWHSSLNKLTHNWRFDKFNNVISSAILDSDGHTDSELIFTYSISDPCQLEKSTLNDGSGVIVSMIYDANGCFLHDSESAIVNAYDILDRAIVTNGVQVNFDAADKLRELPDGFYNYTGDSISEKFSSSLKMADVYSKTGHVSQGLSKVDFSSLPQLIVTKNRTDSAGVATAEITGNIPGEYQVMASIFDIATSKYINITEVDFSHDHHYSDDNKVNNTNYSPPESNALTESKGAVIRPENLTVQPNFIPADGISKSIVTAIVTDASNKPVEGVVVSFTVVGIKGQANYVTDYNSSVISYIDSDLQETVFSHYTPWGGLPDKAPQDYPRYNGEIPIDNSTGPVYRVVYPLGNGYRNYDPIYMRFGKPDSESPFGIGGINSYNYAGGDPINNTDPSGHSKEWDYEQSMVIVDLTIQTAVDVLSILLSPFTFGMSLGMSLGYKLISYAAKTVAAAGKVGAVAAKAGAVVTRTAAGRAGAIAAKGAAAGSKPVLRLRGGGGGGARSLDALNLEGGPVFSKVNDGRLIGYHGTSSTFTGTPAQSFASGRSSIFNGLKVSNMDSNGGLSRGRGFYFSTSKELAMGFAESAADIFGGEPKLIGVYSTPTFYRSLAVTNRVSVGVMGGGGFGRAPKQTTNFGKAFFNELEVVVRPAGYGSITTRELMGNTRVFIPYPIEAPF